MLLQFIRFYLPYRQSLYMASTALFGRSNQFLGLELRTRFACMIASDQRYIENERGICGNAMPVVSAAGTVICHLSPLCMCIKAVPSPTPH